MAAENMHLSKVCKNAAIAAEAKYNIPDKMLQAIALVETGHERNGVHSAWPWTVNNSGRGHYFKTQSEAVEYVKKNVFLKQSSVDIGCFQINAKWHGGAFSSAAKMLNPDDGADYAGAFLKSLFEEFGDWKIAASRYHSRNAIRAARYGHKIERAIADIGLAASREKNRSEMTEKEVSNPATLRVHKKTTASIHAAGGVQLVFFTPASRLFSDAERPADRLIELDAIHGSK
ncbi:MAG: transglycosylase SLT domain-containing protein [Marinicaulis sp.]|nr:transglycosylase SLT domain-containing protein [Marinicaulis sp.]